MIKVRNLNSKVHPNDSLFCLTFTAILMASLLAYNYFRNSGPSAVFINLRLEWSTAIPRDTPSTLPRKHSITRISMTRG